MIKILIAVILVIIMFLVNKMCMKKNKYFFPIIPFIISCVIIGISIFQIVQKENEYAADEGYRMETGMDWRRIGVCRTAAECGWPQLFRFKFLLPSDAYRSHELPASGISDLQTGA